MQLLPLSPEQIRLVLRAMKAVALANGSFSDEERTLFEAALAALSVAADVHALSPAEAPEIAAAFHGVEERQHVVQMLVFTAMVDGDASDAEIRVIERFAGALGIDQHFIRGVRSLAEGHLNALRLDMVRRLPPRGHDEPDAREDEGWKGLWKVFGAASRSGEDTALAQRHRDLVLLPEGTLGHAYWDHMSRRGFLFPGERGAILPRGGLHDFMHVLCEYDTTPAGETELSAFTAGLQKIEDPFALLFGTLCMAYLGERLAHGPMSGERRVDALRAPLDTKRVGAAFQRGLFATTDLTKGWDYWADVASPLIDVQRRYNIAAL